MDKDRRLVINMIASIITLICNLSINFFISRYIVNNIGIEAYGFVNLANSMVNYAMIITVALNSVAGRFITVSYHRNKKTEANEYFNSVLIANVFFSFIFAIIGCFVVVNLESLINIPAELIIDVKNLFILVFLNFILSILSTVFTVATFITNRLYLSSIINATSYLLKASLLFILFSTLSPTVVFVGLVSFICTAFVLVSNIYFTRKLLPDINLNPLNFSIKKVKKLFSSGIWGSVSSLSQTLSDGLDLLISNLFISPLAMGQLSIAKTLGVILDMVASSVSNLFSPQLTYYYAKGDIKGLLSELRLNMLVTSAFANIPFCILIAYGKDLIQLWVPMQDATIIYTLLVLTIFPYLNSPAITGLYNVFLITNHLKVNSLFWLGISITNILIVFVLLNTTSLGIFVVAGVSTTAGFIANFTFIPIYAAKCLKQKKGIFYPMILRYLIVTSIMGAVFIGIRFMIFNIDSWSFFLLIVISSGFIGLLINYYLLFTNNERERIKLIIGRKLM